MNELPRPKPKEDQQAQLSVPSSLLTQAQDLGIDAARAAAEGIRRAVVNAQAMQYAEQNREAIDAWNDYIAQNGLPFEDIMEQPV